MPIYEFACPKCRVVFSFLYRRLEIDRKPKCPRCGGKKMTQQVSRFAISRGSAGKSEENDAGGGSTPELDDPRVEQVMMQLEKEMSTLDDSNPKHLAHIMRRMKDLMPSDAMPPELDVAIRRLEAGEDPDKIEEDMGDLLGDLGGGGGGGAYQRDEGLYDP